MGINAQLTVFCDSPGCGCWKYLNNIRLSRAAKEAKSMGWKRRVLDGRVVWWCPGCVAGTKPELHKYEHMGCKS